MSMHKKLILSTLLIVLPLCGVWQLGLGTWIHAKAILAQILLETAWARTLTTSQEVKPWPWADTWPVARLEVPRLGIRRIVLAGASGSSLAFGPGHLFGSAQPDAIGNCVIAGHRDTHFHFLKSLRIGDVISLQSNQGRVVKYTVDKIRIVDQSQTELVVNSNHQQLTMITCYPFNAITPGGPLRFVVIAVPEKNPMKMI